MIEALIFDLDDTLYAEHDFVVSGYRAIAGEVALRLRVPDQQVLGEMLDTLRNEGRAKVLGMITKKYPDASLTVAEMIDLYRGHRPAIRMPDGYRDLLRRLHRALKIGIVTDGLPEVQKRKVRALELDSAVDRIIYTWEQGREMEKPHPFSFISMLEYLGTNPAAALFIGDNPYKDGKGAHDAGMKFVRVVKEDGAWDAANHALGDPADFTIGTLHELPVILKQLG